MATKPSLYVVGSYKPTLENNELEIVGNLVDVSKLDPDIETVLFGYEIVIYATKDYKRIYTNGNNVRTHASKWGVPSTNELDACKEIDFFKQNNIKIKKLCINPTSECLFIIAESGTVYGCGPNALRLGLDNYDNGPQLIPSLHNAVDIKSGEYCSIALCKSDNETASKIISYWTRKYNLPKEIGTVIMMFGKLNSIYSTAGAAYGENGRGEDNNDTNIWREVDILKNIDIIEISMGNSHVLFLDASGDVFALGYNQYGQLGLGDEKNRSEPTMIQYFMDNDIKIKKVSSGCNYNLALSYEGKVYAWGQKTACGIGDVASKHKILVPTLIDFKDKDVVIEFIECGANHSYCRAVNGKHYLFGQGRNQECLIRNVGVIREPICVNDKLSDHPSKSIKCLTPGHKTTFIKLI